MASCWWLVPEAVETHPKETFPSRGVRDAAQDGFSTPFNLSPWIGVSEPPCEDASATASCEVSISWELESFPQFPSLIFSVLSNPSHV